MKFPALSLVLLSMLSLPAGAVTPGADELKIADGTSFGDGALRAAAFDCAMKLPDSTIEIKRMDGKTAAAELQAGRVAMALLPERFAGNKTELRDKAFYARAALLMIVHKSSGLNKISREQLTGILSGKTKTWQTLTTSPYTIALYLPYSGSVGAEMAVQIVSPAIVSPSVYRTRTVKELPLLVSLNERAIAFVPYSASLKLPENVRAVPVDGVEPTPENLRSGRYPLSERLFLLPAPAQENRPAAKVLLRMVNAAGFDKVLAEYQLFR